jgi:hypothetical protein
MYEPWSPGTPVSVNLNRPGHHIIVLTSYKPASFQISEGAGAYVDEVVVVGYYRQQLLGLERIGHAVSVESRTFEDRTLRDLPACGYSLPYNHGGCYTDDLLDYIERTRGPVRSFHGTYRGSRFVLRPDLSADVDVDAASGYELYSYQRPCGDPSAAEWPRTPKYSGRPSVP